MGDLNWTKTSLASSLVRSEAFWCTVLGPEAERQESSKRGEKSKERRRHVDSATMQPDCTKATKERDPRSIECRGLFLMSPGSTNDRLCGWKCQLTGTVKECPIPMSFRCPVSSLHPRGWLWHTRISNIFFWTSTIFFFRLRRHFSARSLRSTQLFLEGNRGWSFRVGRVGMWLFGRRKVLVELCVSETSQISWRDYLSMIVSILLYIKRKISTNL